MRKLLFWLIILGSAYALYHYQFNIRSWFYEQNKQINGLIHNFPRTTCTADSECHLVPGDCGPCSCPVAANSFWKPNCPFPKPDGYSVACSPCFAQPPQVKCINTQCKIVND